MDFYFLKENKNKIVWSNLCSVNNDEVAKYLIKNSSYINWYVISNNSNDIIVDFILKNLDKVDLCNLCRNKNPIITDYLSINKNKFSYLYWCQLSNNPNIFKLDYEKIKINFEPLAEEIIKEVMHPKRINKYLLNHNYDFIEEMFGYEC